MKVVEFTCPDCDDTWALPKPENPREECTECGAALETEEYEVRL